VAIEGSLNTISLASLIQAICLEQRKVALFLRREANEGIIYFDGGEITHATSGSLLGEDAVYDLVTWTEGTFRLGEYDTLPRRTILSDWNFLLMEGMRRMDEYQAQSLTHARPKTALSLKEIEYDRDLEIGLISLLSKLEHSRTKLIDARDRQKSEVMTKLLRRMATIVLQFAKSLPVLQERREAYRNAMTKMAKTYQSNPLFSAKTTDVGEIGQNLAMLLERFFSIFGTQFASSAVADKWIEASAVFLKDLSKTLDEAQSQPSHMKG
jgi:hypothetical protein